MSDAGSGPLSRESVDRRLWKPEPPCPKATLSLAPRQVGLLALSRHSVTIFHRTGSRHWRRHTRTMESLLLLPGSLSMPLGARPLHPSSGWIISANSAVRTFRNSESEYFNLCLISREIYNTHWGRRTATYDIAPSRSLSLRLLWLI